MPVSADPNATFKVSLKCDQHLPQAERPWFELKYMVARKLRKALDELDERLMAAVEMKDLPEKGIYFEYVRIGLVRWGNLKDPATGEAVSFDIDKLDDYLTIAEIRELRDYFISQGFGLDERKNFK